MTFAKIITILLLAAIGLAAAVTITDTGNGKIYTLSATQDASLEDATTTFGNDGFLNVGLHPDHKKERFLIQFEDLPNSCATIRVAKMYVYFKLAYKAAGTSVIDAPYIMRDLEVRRVKKSWSESEVTSQYRDLSNLDEWSGHYLELENSDASILVQDTVTIVTKRPAGYIEFDVTKAMIKWKIEPNYGLIVRATNEDTDGRELQFFSRDVPNDEYRPFVNVLCDY